ncbi:MAG: 2-oxo acid dehydrogenase subunit E2 [Williamsia sp.]|nr:2-oxo acid dehydrogenase subunit E2 [Williamsia sp.]
MATIDLVMPKMGESITEATILKWLKKPGDAVQQDEAIVEIATDKVDSEVPSIASGIIEEILFGENDVVPVGTTMAKIKTEEDHHPTPEPAQPEPAAALLAPANGQSSTEPSPKTDKPSGPAAVNKFYSPLVLNIAASEGISLSELEKIPGTGNEGRVSKKDILLFVENRKKGTHAQHPVEEAPLKTEQAIPETASQQVERAAPLPSAPPPQYTGGNTEIIEMDRMRRLIADHMIRSKQTSAHVTSFSEADVTNLVLWREKVKGPFEKREGTKITFTPLFMEAVIKCIKKYPLINSSVEGDRILVKKDINIGMATALPSGNLVVPVIKGADQLNLVGLAKQVNALAENARQGRLKPQDTQEGTFTLTNVGTFGSLMGTPIINQPQSAILAVGIIKKRPVVIETAAGDSIAIRHMMYLSLSYDHRIIDGSLGASFLTAVATELENFDPSRSF